MIMKLSSPLYSAKYVQSCPPMPKHTDHFQINPEWSLFSERIKIIVYLDLCALKQCLIILDTRYTLNIHHCTSKTVELYLSHLYALSYLPMTIMTGGW